MIVAVALFAVVMLVSVGALLSLVGANRKAQALQSVINNLNISVDGMTRAIRMGSSYRCGATQPLNSPDDCPDGNTMISFLPYNAPADNASAWVYMFDSNEKRLMRSVDGGATYHAITAPEITIEDLRFFVIGTDRGCTVNPCDTVQPKVLIVIKGTAPVQNSRAKTTFHLQVTGVQRLLDL
jgi:type II secretory pathway pseudopilin PulG